MSAHSAEYNNLNEPQCHEITYRSYCGTSHTNGWCQWSDSLRTCINNFSDSALFTDALDPIVSKSVTFCLYFVLLFIIYKCSEIIVNHSKIFNRLSQDDMQKCKVYIFELVVITFCFIWFSYSGLLMFAFSANSLDNSRDDISAIVRGGATTHILVICYMMEFIFHPKMRIAVKIHHVSSIIGILFFWIALASSIDRFLSRIAIILMLFPFTEHNVFIQLLSHNIYKPHHVSTPRYSFGWIFHFISTLLFIVTRIIITILFVSAYSEWCAHINLKEASWIYTFYFVLSPIICITLIVAQLTSISALFHISKAAESLNGTISKANLFIKAFLVIFMVGFGVLFYLFSTHSFQINAHSCHNIDSYSNTIFDTDLCGLLVSQQDATYNDATNQYAKSSFPERVNPKFVLYPKCDGDIFAAISYAKQCGYIIAIRSGGHQYSGLSSCTGTCIQIDMIHYDEIRYDGEIARVGVGNTNIKLTQELHQRNLMMPTGVCPFVAVGGHFQTGGSGIFKNTLGNAIDHILSFNIILSNGDKYNISKPKNDATDGFNDDLYWAVLGGGAGSWGIVTDFTVKPIKNEDYPNSVLYAVIWQYNKDVHIAISNQIISLRRHSHEYTFTIYVLSEWSVHGTQHDIILIAITYSGGGQRVFNESVPYSVINAGQNIAAYRDLIIHKGPLSGLNLDVTAPGGIFSKEREYNLPYVRQARYANGNISNQWIKAHGEKVDKVMKIKGMYITVGSVYRFGKNNAIYEYDPNSNLTSLSHRNATMEETTDIFYNKTENQNLSREYVTNFLDEMWKHWLIDTNNDAVHDIDNNTVLFGDGGDWRQTAYTFGDLNISNVWKHYYPSKDIYNRLRAIKTNVDPINLFRTQFTIPPYDIRNISTDENEINNRFFFGSKDQMQSFIMSVILSFMVIGLISLMVQMFFGFKSVPYFADSSCSEINDSDI